MPGTKFTKATLIGTVRGNYERLIQQQHDQIKRSEENDYEARANKWRAEQTERLLVFAERLKEGQVGDKELEDFSVKSAPRRWEVEREVDTAKREIERLELRRDKALSYVEALVDTDGVVEVYAGDLKRIGYGE